jgi:hypothetical protein
MLLLAVVGVLGVWATIHYGRTGATKEGQNKQTAMLQKAGKEQATQGVRLDLIGGRMEALFSNTVHQQQTTAKQQQVTAEDIKEMKSLLMSIQVAQMGAPETNCSGLSLHCLLRLNDPVNGRNNFLFDVGQSLEHDRISLFVDANRNLCVQALDGNARRMLVRVPPGLGTFTFGTWMYLIFEYGHSQDLGFVRLLINGRELSRDHYDGPFVVGPNGCDLVMGSDLARQNGGVFDMEETAVYGKTSTSEMRSNMIKYLDNRMSQPGTSTLSFQGGQWLENRSGGFLNPPPPK